MFPLFTNGEFAAMLTALKKQIETLKARMPFYEDYEKPDAEQMLADCKSAYKKIVGEDYE